MAAVVVLLCACGSGGGNENAVTTTSSQVGGIGLPSPTPPNPISSSSVAASSSSAPREFTGSLADTPVAEPTAEIVAKPSVIARLNRSQYNNTVRDLLGTRQRPADTFPEDDFGAGFNHIGSVLSVSAIHLEQYYAAARALADELIGLPAAATVSIRAEDYYAGYEHIYGGFVSNWGNDEVVVPFEVPAPGLYRITIEVVEYPVGTDHVAGYAAVAGQKQVDVSVSGTHDTPQHVTFDVQLAAGQQNIAMGFSNAHDVALDEWRGLGVRTFSIQGPLENTAAANWVCALAAGAECAQQLFADFVPRAWRRPISVDELNGLLAIYDNTVAAGGDHSEGLKNTLVATLLSPHFVYRSEIDDGVLVGETRELTSYELASRLSYFLWSSTPDNTLWQKAVDQSLLDDAVLSAEVDRMLASEKAESLIENFMVQWLKFDKVTQAAPNNELFPDFDTGLVEAMRAETRLFVQALLDENAPVKDLLTANFTYLNATLARHYGVSGVSGNNFRRHEWQGGDRQGLLGQASILTATSHASTTSPVKRGVWVLDTLLCQEPPPPPPGVENLAENGSFEGLSTRERFELHSQAGTSCQACHVLMDPIGFGMETYDPIGRFRSQDNGAAIDASGILPMGTGFNGPWELGQLLATSPRLPLCVAEHMLTFALGRPVEGFHFGVPSDDYPLVHAIYQATREDGNRLGDMIKAVVLSPAFRQRLAQESVQEGAQP